MGAQGGARVAPDNGAWARGGGRATPAGGGSEAGGSGASLPGSDTGDAGDSTVVPEGVHQENMGLQRKIKILAKRTIQEAQAVTLHPAKTKRPRSEEEEEAAASTPTALCGGGGLEGALHCPPAPKKPRLVMGCSLNGFKVLSVVDLRFFLR
ncbi:hypothetical protein OsI_07040 [Oryza sativa Indica Group]|uniref:Uncharacterized protein n=1 Tax=Oryza sativa subsp. indica TaxID=39946 RepID=B8AH32_ORYSI|nr:hypothetical protein OsI_07040 [Oryza sativa Indica Group]